MTKVFKTTHVHGHMCEYIYAGKKGKTKMGESILNIQILLYKNLKGRHALTEE